MVDRRQNAGIGAIIRKVQFKQKLMKLRKDLPLYSVGAIAYFLYATAVSVIGEVRNHSVIGNFCEPVFVVENE